MLSPPSRPRSRWWSLLRPTWLAWHAFAVLAAAGMLWLGDWQLHRAEAGNELSWAYTFEWPLFAVLGAVFWVKTVRAELRAPGADGLVERASDERRRTDAGERDAGDRGAGARPGRRWIGDGRRGCDRLCGPAAHGDPGARPVARPAVRRAPRRRPPGGTARREALRAGRRPAGAPAGSGQ